ncbi:MAG: enoyl-CoA hydratase/isomerase family protein [Candidatus Hermodarchaeota archaeon]
MEKKVKLEIKNNIGIITLIDSENLNPLNLEAGTQILEILESLRNNKEVKCLIITGSGKAFSAGGDIKKFKKSAEDGTAGQVMDDLTKILYKIALVLRLYPKPVIAAVNGWAVGAGMNLALSCDFIIASQYGRFRQSFCKLALIPGFAGTILLSRQLTWQQAVQMSFFGDTYSAEEMKTLGFVNEIVQAEELEEASLKWAEKFANGPLLAFARTKELFFKALSTPLEEHLEYERQMQIKSAESEDYKIGVTALIEKKEPEFIGK